MCALYRLPAPASPPDWRDLVGLTRLLPALLLVFSASHLAVALAAVGLEVGVDCGCVATQDMHSHRTQETGDVY